MWDIKRQSVPGLHIVYLSHNYTPNICEAEVLNDGKKSNLKIQQILRLL